MFLITLTFKIWINNMILNKSAGELASGQLRLGSTCLKFVVLSSIDVTFESNSIDQHFRNHFGLINEEKAAMMKN